nr:F-box only protein 43-like [Procambarus clarkii]
MAEFAVGVRGKNMESNVSHEPVEGNYGCLHPANRGDSSTNDSGYSSDILTSPESIKEFPVPQVPDSKEAICLTPDITKRRTGRLTSTPFNHSSGTVLSPPITKIEPVDGASRSRQISTGDSTLYITSSLEICELEMTCEGDLDKGTNLLQKNEQLVSEQKKSAGTKQTSSKTLPSARFAGKRKKPLNILNRMLKDTEYLVFKVLKYMSGQDLLHLSHVNQQLRNIILQNKVLDSRRMSYINRRRKEQEHIGKENFKLKRVNEGAGSSLGTLSPRKELSCIENLRAKSPKKPLPTFSVKSLTLSERFIEEGQRLPQGEELQKCVKCKAPAKVLKPQQRAVCSQKTCGYDYCTRCHLPRHSNSKDCSVLKPRTRQGSGIFSSKCKRSLRRL